MPTKLENNHHPYIAWEKSHAQNVEDQGSLTPVPGALRVNPPVVSLPFTPKRLAMLKVLQREKFAAAKDRHDGHSKRYCQS